MSSHSRINTALLITVGLSLENFSIRLEKAILFIDTSLIQFLDYLLPLLVTKDSFIFLPFKSIAVLLTLLIALLLLTLRNSVFLPLWFFEVYWGGIQIDSKRRVTFAIFHVILFTTCCLDQLIKNIPSRSGLIALFVCLLLLLLIGTIIDLHIHEGLGILLRVFSSILIYHLQLHIQPHNRIKYISNFFTLIEGRNISLGIELDL